MLTFERHLACVYVESEQPSLQLLFKNLCDIIASNRISIVSRKGKHRLKFSSCNSTYCCGCCVSSLPVGGLSNALNVVKVGSRCGEMKRPLGPTGPWGSCHMSTRASTLKASIPPKTRQNGETDTFVDCVAASSARQHHERSVRPSTAAWSRP
jgi:hypothetical protein